LTRSEIEEKLAGIYPRRTLQKTVVNSAYSTDKSKPSSPNSDSSPLSPSSWSSRSQYPMTHPTTIPSFAEIRPNPQRMKSSQNIHDPQIRETHTGPHLLQATTPFHRQYSSWSICDMAQNHVFKHLCSK